MDFSIVFSPAPGPNTSAMEADTSKVYWYAPDSVVESGGVISAWNDKTSNGYNLGQVGSMPLPSYVSTGTGYVEFDGTEIIGLSSFAFANSIKAAIDGGGAGAVFVVAGNASHSLPVDTADTFPLWVEGLGTNVGANQLMSVAFRISTFFTPPAAQWQGHNGRFAVSYSTDIPAPLTQAAYTDGQGTFLAQHVVDQTDASMNVNDGTYTVSATPTVADFSDDVGGLYLGGLTDDNLALSKGWTGRIYEVFATTDASSTNVNAIRAELIAKYSIT